MLANRLRFQFFALAPGVLALAGYFQGAFRIGTGIVAVFFPSAGIQLQAGGAHLDIAFMGAPFVERTLLSLSRRNCSVENLGIALNECPCSARKYICPRTSRSIPPAETTVCSVLLIMSTYLDVRLSTSMAQCPNIGCQRKTS